MKYDVVIIGAGPGGYSAAIRLGQYSKKVLLIEKEKIGGECLNYGCIPSKALIEVANNVAYLREMPGITLRADIDMKTWQEWKWKMINKLTGGIETLCKGYEVDIIHGKGEIIDSESVSVNDTLVQYDKLIVATGSSTVLIPSFDSVDSNREILDLSEIPKKLAIIGGGYIGIELGIAFSKLGSEVTVIEMMPTILPGVEREFTIPVERRLSQLNVKVLTGRRVESIKKTDRYTILLEGGEIMVSDRVMVAVGRKPNTAGIGLEKVNIKMDGKFIKVDKHMRTSAESIYAIGDVAGEPMLAHKAYLDAEVAVENIMGNMVEVDYSMIPYTIYSDPEISYVGNRSEKKSFFPIAANGRAAGMNTTNGFFTIYYNDQAVITGGAILGPHSSELISEVSMAVEKKMTIYDIGKLVHPHPTISEGIRESAEIAYGKAVHFRTAGKKIR